MLRVYLYLYHYKKKETMRLHGSADKDMGKSRNGENVPKGKITEVLSLYCNIVNNNYSQTLKVLFTFVPNKAFGQLINISQHILTILKTLSSEILFTKIWLTGQTKKPFEIEDKVNMALIIGKYINIEQILRYSVKLREQNM